ncbi:MAG: hypothetical protein M1268_03485, partial [Patescibacteria group bacterium]|nr:hypothetical protein [Patescibacteria group bacterium]
MFKRLFSSIIIFLSLFFFLFLFNKVAFAVKVVCSPGGFACTCTPDSGGSCMTQSDMAPCDHFAAPKNNQCFQNPWTFQYANGCQMCLDLGNPGQCTYNYTYTYVQCSTQDRCYGSNTGASGYDAQGRVLPGICSAGSYNGSDPNSACVSGGWYKTCCSPGGGYPTTYCSGGTCPAGQITAANVTSCYTPPAATNTPTPTSGPSCNCSYTQSCTTGGQPGTQTCSGILSGGTCVWDSSGKCAPNCGTCNPNAGPTPTSPPPPSSGSNVICYLNNGQPLTAGSVLTGTIEQYPGKPNDGTCYYNS